MATLEEKTISDPVQSDVAKPSFGDFTRKSVVGAVYRVSASFMLDALYLTTVSALGYYVAKDMDLLPSISIATSDFFQNLDPTKLGRVALFVVGINFVDYKYNVTQRLDNAFKHVLGTGKEQNKYEN